MTDEANANDFGEDFDDEEIFDEDAEVTAIPQNFITVQSSAGGARQVVTDEPMTVLEVMQQSELRFAVGSEFWLNSAQVKMDDVVPINSTLTVIASVKGG